MSDPADINDRLEAAADKAEGASEIMRRFSNDPAGTYISTESGPLPSLAEWLEINEAALGGVAALQEFDDALQEADDPAKGAALVGFDGLTVADFFKSRNNRVVDSIAALKALDKTKYTRAFVAGYYAAGDGGGGAYWYDSGDTTSTDNGCTIVVAIDGGRWKLTTVSVVTAKQFGCKGDDSADDTARMDAATTWALATGNTLHFPKGTYRRSTAWNLPTTVHITAEHAARIKLTASAAHVMKVGSAPSFVYLASVGGLVLDGNGFAAAGLVLERVISSDFQDIRTTNVTGAGLHMKLAQLCTFGNYTCSKNVEPFSTTPVNGILADTESSSANTFINPTIEHVSGAGIKGVSLINSVFIDGTSEGNAIGIELGSDSGGLTAIGNNFVGMDLEVNSTTDIKLRATADGNTFNVNAGFESPEVQIDSGANRNLFNGGFTGGFNIAAGALNTIIKDVNLLGAGRTVTDAGTNTIVDNVYNMSDAMFAPGSGGDFRRVQISVPAAGSYAINCNTADYVVLEAAGSTMTVSAPTNPRDGQEIDITIWNTSGGAITVTWNAVFRMSGWVNPAAGFNRSARFRYNSTFGRWYMIAVVAADIAN